MPLSKRVVRPVKLSEVVVPDFVKNELEFVANATVCNEILQIASIGRLAHSVFEELERDLFSLAKRAANLQARVVQLNADIEKMRNGDEDLTAGIPPVELPVFVSKKPADSQVLSHSTIPESLQLRYEEAEPAPALQQMDALRTDQKTSMKLYSYPGFFFEWWSQEMLHDNKHKRAPRKKRPKVKGKAPARATAQHGPQKPQLVIQQTGVGGHYIDTQNTNGPSTYPEQVKSPDDSTTSPARLNLKLMASTLPPPPPPPTYVDIGQMQALNSLKNAQVDSPLHAKSQPVSMPPTSLQMGQSNDGQYSSNKASTISSTVPGIMQAHLHSNCPPPPPAFMNEQETKLVGVKVDASYVDNAANRTKQNDSSITEGGPKVVNNNSGSGVASLLSHELPPPPAPIFDNKCYGDAVVATDPGYNNATNSEYIHEFESSLPPPSPPPPPPPPLPISPAAGAKSQTGVDLSSSPPLPPPPPPSIPIVPFTGTGDKVDDQAKTTPSVSQQKPSLPKAAPDELLSAIRAGLQLRKVSDRVLPNQSKGVRNSNQTDLSDVPVDVQAIYEAVLRRRQCMGNTSSDDDDDDDDDDKDVNSTSSWED